MTKYILHTVILVITLFLFSGCRDSIRVAVSNEVKDEAIIFAFEVYSQIHSKMYITEVSQSAHSAIDFNYTSQFYFYDADGVYVAERNYFFEGRFQRVVNGNDVKIKHFIDTSSNINGLHSWTYWLFNDDNITSIEIIDFSFLELDQLEIDEIKAPERDTILYFYIADEIQTMIEDRQDIEDHRFWLKNPNMLQFPDFGVDDIRQVEIVEHESSVDRVIHIVVDETALGLLKAQMSISINEEGLAQMISFTTRSRTSFVGDASIGEAIKTIQITFNAFNSDVQIALPEIASQFITTN